MQADRLLPRDKQMLIPEGCEYLFWAEVSLQGYLGKRNKESTFSFCAVIDSIAQTINHNGKEDFQGCKDCKTR